MINQISEPYSVTTVRNQAGAIFMCSPVLLYSSHYWPWCLQGKVNFADFLLWACFDFENHFSLCYKYSISNQDCRNAEVCRIVD